MRNVHLFILAAIEMLGLSSECSAGRPLRESFRTHETAYIIPFNYTPISAPYIVVLARINGNLPLSFVVDTGVNVPLILDKSSTEGLKLTRNKEILQLDTGDRRLEGVDIATFELCGETEDSGITVGLKSAYSGDLNKVRRSIPGTQIAGIIGAPLLAKTSVQFDFDARVLRIKPIPAIVDGPALETIPLTLKEGGLSLKVKVEGGVDHQVLLDTGSPVTNWLPSWIPPHSVLSSKRSIYETLSAAILTDKMLVTNLCIGKIKFPRTKVMCEANQAEAGLGLDVLSRCRFTIDFHNRYLLIDTKHHITPVIPTGWSGIDLEEREGRFVVSFIHPSSPASKSNLKIGDWVGSIDDFPTHELPFATVNRLLEGIAGTPARLGVQRKDKNLKVAISRWLERGQMHEWLTGTLIRKLDNGPAEIISVEDKSKAAQAGLQSGDVIQRINGTRSRLVTPSRLLTLLNSKRFELVVYRNNTVRRLLIKKE
jgi:hypothetical protein